jgi:predicted RNA-binding protein with RPS1 domain
MIIEKGKIYEFTVIEKSKNSNSVIIQDEFGEKHIYRKRIDIGLKIRLKIRSIDQFGKCLFSELRDYSKYKISQIYEFEVIETVSKSDDNYFFLIKDIENDFVTTVKAFNHQLPPNKAPKNLFCKVVEINLDEDRFILHQVESKTNLLIFQDGEFYEFKYVGINLKEPKYIFVKGIDGKIYTLIKPLSTDIFALKENDIIKYVCQYNNEILKFKYFVTFEDIIKYRILKQNTFDALKNSNSQHAIKLYEDFNKKNNLWILSFCKLLHDEYRVSFDKDEYEKALMYGEVLVNIEYWIINSGFLNSFHSNIEEKEIYALTTYNRYVVYTKALDILLGNRFFQYFDNLRIEISSLDNSKSIDIDKIQIAQYILILLKDQIKSNKVLEYYTLLLESLGEKGCFKNNELEKQLKPLTYHLKNVLVNFEKEFLSTIFLSVSAINGYYNNNNNIKQYLELLRIYLVILKEYNNYKELNLYILKYLRTLSLYSDNKNLQQSYIQSALKFSKIDFECIESQSIFNWEMRNFDNSLINYISKLSLNKFNKLETIRQLYKENKKIEGKIIGEDRCGYIIEVYGNKSILPKNLIANLQEFDIKNNPEMKISVCINRIDEDFSRILLSNNLQPYNILEQQNLEIGSIVEGVVKRFEFYGAFVDLGSIDGLIHLTDLSYNSITHPSELLRIGEFVKLKVIDNKIVDGKTLVSLSTKELRKSNSNQITLNDSCITRITKVNQSNIIVEVIESGESGIILREEISWDETIDFEKFYSIGDRIKVKCIDKNEKGLFFSIKASITNPYDENENFVENYLGTVFEIQKDLILVKSNELGQFVIYKKEDLNFESLNLSDTFKFNITKIDKKYNEIFINIDFTSVNKNQIEYIPDSIDTKINEEIGKCYELYGMQKEDIDSKHNYLNWAKIYFSLSNSAKSYYLNFYITYQEIIKLSHINISQDCNIANLIDSVIEKSKMLILEIDSKELTIQTFPLLEQLKVTLEILSLFGAENKESMDYLFKVIQSNNLSEKANYQLAKIVLSNNLISSEIKDSHLIKENWLIIHNILESGLLNLDTLPIIDDRASELLKLIRQDENRTLEFKSTLMTPIPDKNKRQIIENLKIELKIAQENNNEIRVEKLTSKIIDLQKNNAKKAVIHSAMKTLVAFANSEGGNLIIGLEDDKNIIGLDFDFKSSTSKRDNLFDSFNLDFDKLINEYIGIDFNLLFDSKAEFIEIDGKFLYLVRVKRSKYPVYIRKDDQGNLVSEVWIRAQGSSNKITKAEELQKFFKQFD